MKRKPPKENRNVLYVQKTLQPEEEIIYVSTFHWIYNFKAILPFLVVSAVALVLFIYGVPWPIYLAVGAGGLWALAFFFRKMAYKWTNQVIITTKRLIVQKGWTNRNTMDLGLDRILGHKIHEDAWGQSLGYGKFTLVGAGVGEIDLPNFMANPARFRRALTGKKESLEDEDDD